MSTLQVLEAGVRSTVQDRGRFAGLRSAVPTAGPADPIAFEAAQGLVGNDGSQAAIEIIGLPFRAVLDRPGVIAATGRDVSLRARARVGGWTATFVRAGEEFTVNGSESTRFAYLAVGGGIALPEVLGSRATYVPASIGPLPRPLMAGDSLPLGASVLGTERSGRIVLHEYERWVLAMPGPHAERLTGAFFGRRFRVSERSDRMGVRLDGAVEVASGEILSIGVTAGAVQVPGGGDPIVLLADGQTTGGYPVVAVVATVSLGSVAQAAPGEELEFVQIDRRGALDPLRAVRAMWVAA